jgi:hypothetical protein
LQAVVLLTGEGTDLQYPLVILPAVLHHVPAPARTKHVITTTEKKKSDALQRLRCINIWARLAKWFVSLMNDVL